MRYDVYFKYRDKEEEDSLVVIENEEALMEFVFALHMDETQEVCEISKFDIVIYPHVEENDLVMQVDTHQLRRIRKVNKHTVHLYNSDLPKELQEEDYYSSIIHEVWSRRNIIPINLNSPSYQRENYYQKSPLGHYSVYSGISPFDDSIRGDF